MSRYSEYEYRKQPGFDMNAFEGAYQAIPMKTLVIHCFDPRAAEIPQAVAAYFGDEVYPGENILDKNGNRVGSTRTLFVETNAGGRAAFALESVAAMDYIFNVSLWFTTRSAARRLSGPSCSSRSSTIVITLISRRCLITIALPSWISRSRSSMMSSCFARARQSRNMSSCTASSTRSVPAS